jgi:uncharacterized membrane protein
MNKKPLVGALAAALLIAITLTGSHAVHNAHAQTDDSDWVITKFDSALNVQKDGRVEVTEEIAVDFKNVEKHGIYRDLPEIYDNGIDGGDKHYTKIDVTDVEMDGSPVTNDITRSDGNMRIKIGDADRTITGSHLYQIKYIATGILLAFEDHDELYWNVTGNGWDAPILESSAAVRLPAEGILGISCYVGGYGDTESCDNQTTNTGGETTEEGFLTNTSGTIAIFSQSSRPLESGEGLTIAVGYVQNMVPILTVAAPKTILDLATGSMVPREVFGLTLVAGITLLIWLWRRKGRDQTARSYETLVVEYESPENLRPGELGTLMDETADTLDVSATVVDLAVRGYLEIKEIPKKGFFSSTDYELTRKKEMDDTLMEYEKILLRGLFENGETVKTSDLKQKFYTTLADIKKELYKHVVAKKFFTGNPNSVRALHGFFAFLVGGLGVFLFIQSIPTNLWSDHARSFLLGVGPALVITGIVYLVLAIRAMPQRTALGRELYLKARGYKEFITNVETYRQRFFEKENMFMEVLPYAMIFGATEKLANAMKNMGVVPPTPTWYTGANAFNIATFSHSISSFSNSLSSTMASAPSSSGSGGGGFSGGGFGGGGGGSW